MNKSQVRKKQSQKMKAATAPSQPILFYLLTGFLILFLPVFHLSKALDPALTPRLFAVSIFLFLFSFLIFNKWTARTLDFSVLKHKIFFMLAAYFLITLVAIVFAINYKEGFFDLVKTFATVAMVAFLSMLFLRTENWQEKLPMLVLIASMIALSIGAVQYYREVVLATNKLMADGRHVIYKVIGLMSHKNHYSTSLFLMLPFLGYGIYIYRRWWRVAFILATTGIFIMILLLQTRSVWLGIILTTISIVATLVIIGNKLGLPKIWRILFLAGIITGIVGLVVVFSLDTPKDQTSTLARLQSITDTRSIHNIHRLSIWNITLNMIEARPYTGVGTGNWKLHAAYYYDGQFDQVPQLNWASPHNDYLWVFAEKGIGGILLFLAIFGFALFYIYKIILGDTSIHDKVFALFLQVGVFGYMVVSFFDFPYDRINQQVYLALTLASVIALYHRLSPKRSFSPNTMVFLIPSLVVLGFGILFGNATLTQEDHTKRALSFMNAGRWQEFLRHAQLAKTPFTSLDLLSNPAEYYQGMAYAKLNQHQKAIEAYEKARIQFPNNMWIINWMGQSYYQVGRYEDAKDCLLRVLAIIPALKEARISLSATLYQMGDYKSSLEALKQIPDYEEDPDIMRNIKVLENKINPIDAIQ